MAGYLEQYGQAELRRERVIRWLMIATAVITIGTLVGYFTLRTYPARRQASSFLEALNKGDYKAAHRMWGCPEPCTRYPFDKFMEDWGPKGEYAGATKIADTSFCKAGVIVTLESPRGDNLALWYVRSDGSRGFSPRPGC
ncbi:MAG: hypothetical protein ACM3ZB_08050, partial [bacterium]